MNSLVPKQESLRGGGVRRDGAAHATLRSRKATAPVLLWRPRDVAAGRLCSSAALRMVELLATRVAQHPMAAIARMGIDILDLGMIRETPEETSQEYARLPFPGPSLDFSATKR